MRDDTRKGLHYRGTTPERDRTIEGSHYGQTPAVLPMPRDPECPVNFDRIVLLFIAITGLGFKAGPCDHRVVRAFHL